MLFRSPVPDAGLPEGRGAVAPPVSAAPAPALHLMVYPDMAVPGKEVVVEAEVVPELPPEKMTLTFRLASDPCNGELDVEGMRAVYEVPPDCRGSKIVIEARLVTDEGERRQSVGLDIKKGSFMDSIVLKYPSPGQRVASPIPVWWDRTLYANRNERIAFTVEVHNALVLKTEEFAPDAVIELDVPPSPEKVFLTAKTSGGTVER